MGGGKNAQTHIHSNVSEDIHQKFNSGYMHGGTMSDFFLPPFVL